MRVNGFRCDVCCKEHLLEPSLILQSYRDALPAEWFIVSQGPYKQDKPWGQEPLLFCSAACLAQWAEKQVVAAREADGPAYLKTLQGLEKIPYKTLTQQVTNEAPLSSTEVFQGLAERLQQLGEVPRKHLMQSNWLPGDEE